MNARTYFKALIVLAPPLLFVPGFAYACQDTESLVFSCTTSKNKVVEVCDAGLAIRYSFGKKGAAPELALTVPRDQASTFQWQGFGRYINYRVSIPNGATIYTVFTSIDKLGARQRLEAGIDVETKDELLASLRCKPGSLQEHLEGIKLKPSE